MDEVNSLRAKVSALEQANNDRQELLESISGKNKELKDALDAAKALYEKVVRDRDAVRADLAQMKSTLSDTQQTLRAVQEDRDEFAAKMNDAVERAEQLEAKVSDLEAQNEGLVFFKDTLLKKNQSLQGQIEAFRFVVEHWRGGGT